MSYGCLMKCYWMCKEKVRHIILIWKIIKNKAQNLSDPILCNFSDRRGRSCVISNVNRSNAIIAMPFGIDQVRSIPNATGLL